MWVYNPTTLQYYTYEEMYEKRETGIYKETNFEIFQKKDFDYSSFDTAKRELIDRADDLYKIDWKNIKKDLEIPTRENVENEDQVH